MTTQSLYILISIIFSPELAEQLQRKAGERKSDPRSGICGLINIHSTIGGTSSFIGLFLIQ